MYQNMHLIIRHSSNKRLKAVEEKIEYGNLRAEALTPSLYDSINLSRKPNYVGEVKT